MNSNSIISIFRFVEPKKGYQPHIDGLRALAVVAVICFHYAPSYFQGGFIGVDVFFVISGYLITGILHQSFGEHSFGFALKKFYQHRIRRIFPAALIILSFLFVVGWLVLFPYELKSLAAHIAAGAGFFENFLLWSESGYFDGEAIKKPLLHFWSLAVEEQFYIFWPLILWLIMWRKLPLLPSIVVIIMVSFTINLASVFSGYDASAFYLPAARVWELMAGAWLAIAQQQRVPWIDKYPEGQSWVGLALVLVGMLTISPASLFPGFYAILPILGTVLLINAGHNGFVNARLASWKPVVWIGVISYPLYLWHWALLSIVAVVYEKRLPGLSWGETKAILAMGSIALAWMTYRLVEGPIRRNAKNSTAMGLIFGMMLVFLVAVSIVVGGGFPNRPFAFVNNSITAVDYIKSLDRTPLEDGCYNLSNKVSTLGARLPDPFYCILGDKNAETFIVAYGDSHSLSMIPVLDKFGLKNRVRIAYSGIDSCLPILGATKVYGKQKACDELAVKMPQLAKEKSARVAIFIQNWPNYLNDMRTVSRDYVVSLGASALRHGLEKTIEFYRENDIKIVFLEDNPGQKMTVPIDRIRFNNDLNDREINLLSISRADYLMQQVGVNSLLGDLARADKNVVIVDNTDAFCGENVCPLAKDGRFLYYDAGHLSTFGAMQAYGNIESILLREIDRGMVDNNVDGKYSNNYRNTY